MNAFGKFGRPSAMAGLFASALLASSLSWSQAIEPGFNANTLAPNDDDSVGPVAIGFDLNFFGIVRSEIFVNNNGNITLDTELSSYTPFDLTSTGQEIIAPFFADVDTSDAGDPVTYGSGTFAGRPAYGVNWINVDYYDSDPAHTNRNSFQLILVDRSDVGTGDFDIVFNYGQIQWETGEASDGDADGLGGDSARVGYSNGTGAPGTFLELAGSAINGALLDGGPNALVSGSLNSPIPGRYIFQARGGNIGGPGTPPGPAFSVPVDSIWSIALLIAALMMTGALVLTRRI